MIDSTDTTDQSVRFNERTGRAVLRRVGWYAAVACAGGIAFAMGYGWANWLLAYWFFLCLVGWLSNTLKATEWTVAGRELGRRGWLSWPGRKPSKVMDLGPDVEAVHETRYLWRICRTRSSWRHGRPDASSRPWNGLMSASTTGAETGRTDIDC